MVSIKGNVRGAESKIGNPTHPTHFSQCTRQHPENLNLLDYSVPLGNGSDHSSAISGSFTGSSALAEYPFAVFPNDSGCIHGTPMLNLTDTKYVELGNNNNAIEDIEDLQGKEFSDAELLVNR